MPRKDKIHQCDKKGQDGVQSEVEIYPEMGFVSTPPVLTT